MTKTKKKENAKEKKSKKNYILVALIILLLLIIAGLLIYIIVIKDDNKITINTNGGSEVEVVINENILEVPEQPKKEGYIFGGWKNQKNEMIVSKVEVTEDTTLDATWIKEDEQTTNITYEIEEEKTYEIVVVDNTNLILPATPYREGYIFIGWFDLDGNVVTEDYLVSDEITLIAKWVKEGTTTYKVKYESEGGSDLPLVYVLEDGKLYFPITPVREGYVFAGWVDQEGKSITKDTKITEDTTLKAVWKTEYTCPEDCKVSEDGKTCTITKTTKVSSKTTCPSGSELRDGYCLKTSGQINLEANTDYPCTGKNEYKYVIIEGYGATRMCAKKVDKVSAQSCPSGYKKNGETCTKTETKKCTQNKAVQYN